MTDRAARIRNQAPPNQSDGNTVAIVIGVLVHAVLLTAGLAYLPLLHMYTGSNPLLLSAVFVLLMGSIAAYALRNHIGFTSYSAVSVFESLLISVVAGIAAAQNKAFERLQQFEEEFDTPSSNESELAQGPASDLSGGGDLSGAFNVESAVNPDLFFVTVFLLFNAPFLYYYVKRTDTDWRYLALYLLPILIYLAMRFVASGMIAEEILATEMLS